MSLLTSIITFYIHKHLYFTKRELRRMKRDAEKRTEREEERLLVEKRRQMTDEERRRDDLQ